MSEEQIADTQPAAGFVERFVWKCPISGCGEVMEFIEAEGGVINFLIVHHLARKHGFQKEQVIACNAGLEKAAEEYFDAETGKEARVEIGIDEPTLSDNAIQSRRNETRGGVR